jgi:hypothetical protein
VRLGSPSSRWSSLWAPYAPTTVCRAHAPAGASVWDRASCAAKRVSGAPQRSRCHPCQWSHWCHRPWRSLGILPNASSAWSAWSHSGSCATLAGGPLAARPALDRARPRSTQAHASLRDSSGLHEDTTNSAHHDQCGARTCLLCAGITLQTVQTVRTTPPRDWEHSVTPFPVDERKARHWQAQHKGCGPSASLTTYVTDPLAGFPLGGQGRRFLTPLLPSHKPPSVLKKGHRHGARLLLECTASSPRPRRLLAASRRESLHPPLATCFGALRRQRWMSPTGPARRRATFALADCRAAPSGRQGDRAAR